MNNKFKLFGLLKDKNILISINKRFFIKYNEFKPFKIISTEFDKNIIILNTPIGQFEYWINQDIFIPPWQTHWFQLKDSILFRLKDNLLDDLLKKAINKAGNLNRLCKSLDMSAPTFYNLRNKKKIKMISIKKLKKLLDYLNINYSTINDKFDYTKKGIKISIKNPKFPIDLNSNHGALLLGAIVSDGCIYIDKKARGVLRTKYSTNEKESIRLFVKAINQTYGQVYIQKEKIRNCDIIKIGSSIIGETLLKVGAILGHKAKVGGDVPWMIRYGSKDIKRPYLKAVFSDEGSIYIGKRSDSYLILSRYKHLKDIKKEDINFLKRLEKHMTSTKFPTGHINKSITVKRILDLLKNNNISTMLKSPPRLLLQESRLLEEFGIENRLWSRKLTKTDLGNYSVCHDLFINKNKSIIKFYKEIGFSLKKKQEKLIKIVKNINNNGFKTV